jgi:rhodanese-related sulfurtransferase
MQVFKFFSVVLVQITFAALSMAHAQSDTDFMQLVHKTDSGTFEIEGAVSANPEQAAELLEAGVPFVDVRREIQFKTGHIPGAISIELKTQFTEERLNGEFPKDQQLVFYCSDAACYRSAHASTKAITWGYTDVVYFADGWSKWLAQGYPTE